ncbi:MAG TPA: HAMP domain-containing sensor histidine kinase [Elusimicrobiota bacterium]|nr:HAMP domain-containing sensor histidine kinase [Elusimicrobiota bacterium]
MKLWTKFSLFSSGLVALVIVGTTFSMLYLEKRHLLSEMTKGMHETAKSLQKVSAESFLTNNRVSLISYMKEVRNARGVAFAQVVEKSGKIHAHTDSDRIGRTVDDPFVRQALDAGTPLSREDSAAPGGTVIELAYPVNTGGPEQAAAVIGFSRDALETSVRRTVQETKKRLLHVALIALVFGVLGAVLLAAVMTGPIRRMVAAAEKIGQGKLDTRVEVSSTDELGHLAQSLNAMAVKLHELDQLKQDFVSSVTHEFRSPLSAMKAHFDLFFRGRLGTLTEEQKESLTVLSNNAARLGRFIDDLLDIAKIERGKMDIKPEVFDPGPVLKDIHRLFQPRAEQKGIDLRLELPEKMPPLFADPGRTGQIVTNLVSNALKFTEKGNIALKVEADEKCLHILVSDTGMGIPEDQLDRIFNKFEQVKDARNRTTEQKGTGLGLAIARALAERQGGALRAQSVLGQGSTFILTVPVHAAHPGAPA